MRVTAIGAEVTKAGIVRGPDVRRPAQGRPHRGGSLGVPRAGLRSLSRLQDLVYVLDLDADVIIKDDDQEPVCRRCPSRSSTSAQATVSRPHLRQLGCPGRKSSSARMPRAGRRCRRCPKPPDHPQQPARGGQSVKTRRGAARGTSPAGLRSARRHCHHVLNQCSAARGLLSASACVRDHTVMHGSGFVTCRLTRKSPPVASQRRPTSASIRGNIAASSQAWNARART